MDALCSEALLDVVECALDMLMDVLSRAGFSAHDSSAFRGRLHANQVNRGSEMAGQFGGVFEGDSRRRREIVRYQKICKTMVRGVC